MPDIPLEIKAEGDDFVQLPIRVIMDMKGPGEIIVNVCKVDSDEVYCELGRFSVVEMDWFLHLSLFSAIILVKM